jgi:hypothetical protein
MRKLALLTTLIIAAMAMTATTASAAIEVTDPDSGELCSEVSPAINAGNANLLSTTTNYSSGGCSVHLSSAEQTRIRWGANSIYSPCNVQFDAHIGPDGWGLANNFSYSCSGGTAVTACAGSRVIAPASYNPYIYGTTLAFPFANASTDLNVAMCGIPQFVGSQWGLMSIDVTQAGATTLWDNQQDAAGGNGFNQFHQGKWANAVGSHPVITQL